MPRGGARANSGGARVGAGRPPKEKKGKRYTFYVSPENLGVVEQDLEIDKGGPVTEEEVDADVRLRFYQSLGSKRHGSNELLIY